MNGYRIKLQLELDPITGKPFYEKYDPILNDLLRIPYNPTKNLIPKEFRKWIRCNSMNSGLFNELFYCGDFVGTISEICENYPAYEDITNSDIWSEQEHNELREALNWFSKDSIYLIDCWTLDY
jgi:hypothetical protein